MYSLGTFKGFCINNIAMIENDSNYLIKNVTKKIYRTNRLFKIPLKFNF